MNITKEQYLQALHVVWKEYDREMIQAYFDLDGYKASSEYIARILGKSSLVVVNSKFGKLGRRIADHLDIKPPVRNNESYRWWYVLADGVEEDHSFKWIQRPNFVSALHEFGFRKTENTIPEELSDAQEYIEGAKRQITVNAYERNDKARAACIEHYGGYTCQVCEFDFEEVYGALGKDFIHVHHLQPLAAKTEEYKVDPAKDLIPVCPNCHAMLHKENPPITVEKLRNIINENQVKATQQLQKTD